MTAVEAQTRASSSSARMKERASAPAPPYSSGTIMPRMPSSARPARTSRGKRSSRSRSATPGAISVSAESRTASRIRACSSVNSKFMASAPDRGSRRRRRPRPRRRRRSAGGGAPLGSLGLVGGGPAPPGPGLRTCSRGGWRRAAAFGPRAARATERRARGGPRAFPGRRGPGGASSRGAAREYPPTRSSRCRNVTTISGRPARARRKSTILARSAARGSPESDGIRSASKSIMRVQQTRFVRPSGASRTMTKRSRSWSSA